MHTSSWRVYSRNPGYTSYEPQGRRVPIRTYPSFPQEPNHHAIPSHKLINPQEHHPQNAKFQDKK